MTIRVTIEQAKDQLRELVGRAAEGEAIVIVSDGVDAAVLQPVTEKRPLGFLAALGPIPADAFDADPADWADEDAPV